MKDEMRRREWARENEMSWVGWDALASRKWLRMENTGRVVHEGKAVFERWRSSSETSIVRSKKSRCISVWCTRERRGGSSMYLIFPRSRPSPYIGISCMRVMK